MVLTSDNSSRRRVSHLAMLVVLAAGPMAVTPAFAGDVNADGEWNAPTASAGQTAETLPTVTVTGEQAPSNNQKRETGVSRLPQEIQDTPQTIQVINGETLRQQGVTTLDQALRNVPGITVAVGEGGGGMNGDQFRIRGFDAKNDIFSDGLRDFGVYTRDAFNTEEVQVFLGPSGESFGRGNFGGVINSNSKTPVLDDFITLRGELGLGPHLRATGDVNYQIGDTTAVRLNVMYTDAQLVGRDVPEAKRWGVAPSIGFGLGTDTTLTIAYLHQEEQRVPDYGLPTMLTGVGEASSGPAPVNRENWYGSNQDHDDTTVDMVTVRASHKANEWLQITNDTRASFFSRDFLTTIPSCGAPCVTALYGPNPDSALITYGGGTPYYNLDNWGLQNITTAVADFNIGGFKNQFVAGLDVSYESADRVNYTGQGATSARPQDIKLNDPRRYDIDLSGVTVSQETETNSTNLALFASEQFWITSELSVLAGLRWDNYDTEMDRIVFTDPTGNSDYSQKGSDSLLNPKASVIWEPSESQTYYFSWAKSSQPAAGSTGASNEVTPLPSDPTTPGSINANNLDPIESETFEIGAKIGLFDQKLGIGIAVFQTERDNASEQDPISGNVVANGQSFRNRGVELSLSGQITPEWGIQASYTYIDSEYTDFANSNSDVNDFMNGRVVNFVPESAATLWTTYAPIEELTFGAGVRYQDSVYLAQSYTPATGVFTYNEIPYYLTVDAMVSYEISNGVIVQVNGYNLLDREDNFTQAQSGRAVPAAGRTVIFSTQATF